MWGELSTGGLDAFGPVMGVGLQPRQERGPEANDQCHHHDHPDPSGVDTAAGERGQERACELDDRDERDRPADLAPSTLNAMIPERLPRTGAKNDSSAA
ncbi:hypothetical protein [Salinispora tropica]|uniref:hypothetical protein n=1 Tax=Salinispora tropica TaxID=168695 RepID=UPI0003A4A074|nr:hypothetical protein [Salinispora tropica]